MQPARTAERQQAKPPRVQPLLEQAQPDRRRQARIGQRQHAFRRRFRVEPHPCAQPGQRAVRRCAVQRQSAAEEIARVQPAEHQVGVRHRRLRAAAAVAGRPGLRARAPRSHHQPVARQHRGDRSAAGSDRADLHHRQAHRLAVDLALRHRGHHAAADHADVEARTAHVDPDQIRHAQPHRRQLRRQRPAARPRQQQPHRLRARHRGAAHPAIGLHQQQPGGEAALGHAMLQPGQVGADDGDQQRVQHRRRTPLEFADLRTNLGGERDRQVRERLRQMRAQRPLVPPVDMRMQQAHRDRFRPMRPHRRLCRRQRCRIQRQLGAAIRPQPLRHLDPPLPRDQRRFPDLVQPVDVPPRMPPDLQHVAEPGRRQQQPARQLALQHRIGRDRRPVQQQPDIGEREAEPRRRLVDPRQQPERGIVRRRRRLDAVPRPARLIQNLQVGERPADIDPDPYPPCHHPPPFDRRAMVADRSSIGKGSSLRL